MYEAGSGSATANVCAVTPEYTELDSSAWVGVAIALCANSVIPIALNAQKLAHKQNTQEDGKQARPMTQLPLWWVGITTMIAGESLNFLAYGYAPASIVAPIGATSVFVNGIITTTVMKEPFTCRSGVGLVLIACGVVTLVTAIPPSGIELTSEMLATTILPSPRAWGYVLGVCIFVLSWQHFVVPKYKDKHVLVYLMLCSVISSVTVVSCRAFMSISTDVLASGGLDQLASPVPFAALTLVIVTAIWSTYYLNKAMILFRNSEVVPVYFTSFTLASIGAGALVYREFQCLTPATAIAFATGCLGTFIGVKLVASHQPGRPTEKLSRFRRLVEPSPLPGAGATGEQRLSGGEGEADEICVHVRTEPSLGAELTCISTMSSACSADQLLGNGVRRQPTPGGSLPLGTPAAHDGSSGAPSAAAASSKLGLPLLEDGGHATAECSTAQPGSQRHRAIVPDLRCGDPEPRFFAHEVGDDV